MKMQRWVHIMMVVVGLTFVAHMVTQFVIPVEDLTRRGIAFVQAGVFTIATAALTLLAVQEKRFGAFRTVIAASFIIYLVMYTDHLYYLRDPSGWGWKSGFILFAYNCALLAGCYLLLVWREWVVDLFDHWHDFLDALDPHRE